MTDTQHRGQSSPLAVVLLVGMVSVGAVSVLLIGGVMLDEGKDRAEMTRIEQSFQVLDDDMEAVTGSQSGASRTVDLDVGGSDAAVRKGNTGRVIIETSERGVLVNESIGSIEYRSGNGLVAYQNGGVWRGTGNSTRMVSRPDMTYDTTRYESNPTLSVPIVALDGDRTFSSGEIGIESDGSAQVVGNTSVLEGELVTISVRSEYYVGWAEYFRTITDDDAVDVDHGSNTASMELKSPSDRREVSGGIVSGGSGSELSIGQKNTLIDSYNSSNGPYVDGDNEANVVLGGDLTMKQDATIEGDVTVGGDVTFKQDAQVNGDVSYVGRRNAQNGDDHWTGEIDNDVTVRPHSPVDYVIDDKREVLSDSANNSNGDAADISDGELDDCDPCRLESGSYVLEEIDLQGDDELVFNTSEDDIEVVVNESIDLASGDAKIRVTNESNRVNLFVDGESGDNLALKGGANVSVPNDRSTALWVYMNPDSTTSFKQNSRFVGVVYGPGPEDDPGTTITMKQDATVYGALVGEVDSLSQDTSIHYDQALTRTDSLALTRTTPRLTFLHVAVHDVEIENE